jgi:hypothetical protein
MQVHTDMELAPAAYAERSPIASDSENATSAFRIIKTAALPWLQVDAFLGPLRIAADAHNAKTQIKRLYATVQLLHTITR